MSLKLTGEKQRPSGPSKKDIRFLTLVFSEMRSKGKDMGVPRVLVGARGCTEEMNEKTIRTLLPLKIYRDGKLWDGFCFITGDLERLVRSPSSIKNIYKFIFLVLEK